MGQAKEAKIEKKQAANPTEADNKVQANQKYWKNSIRKVLYQYMYLITPPNGLFSQYLQTNSINYINIGQ